MASSYEFDTGQASARLSLLTSRHNASRAQALLADALSLIRIGGGDVRRNRKINIVDCYGHVVQRG